MFSHDTETVGIVYQKPELIFLFESHNLIHDSESAGHTEYAFSNHKYSTALLICHLGSSCKDSFAIGSIVVTEFIFFSYMETDSIQQASVSLGIVHDDIVTGHKSTRLNSS